MLPQAWDRAGTAPYLNVIGLDPQLVDPAHGDYRPAPGSPAEEYGCQTFPPPGAALIEPSFDTRAAPLRRDVLYVSGPLLSDTIWNVDVVKVTGDVLIADGVTLSIAPGVRVEFEDYYSLTVAGTLLAVGTPTQRILFTTDEPQRFRVDASHEGCWNGIRFQDTLATNAASQLAYCTLEYSKAAGGGNGPYPYGGGALSVAGYADLAVEHCLFRQNVADYGGALFLYRQGNIRLADSVIVDNHALQNGSAIFCAYSYPQIVNNTVVRNTIQNADNPYIETCALLNFCAKPLLANNIIRDNDPILFYMHSQAWANKSYYTLHNNIADYIGGTGNIDVDPAFLNPVGWDGLTGTADDNFRLHIGSPCVDAGLNAAVPVGLDTDYDGVARAFDGDQNGLPHADMGAHEAGDCNENGVADTAEIAGGQAADCNANLVPDNCEITLFRTSLDCNATSVPDECELMGPGDFDGDGTTDHDDLELFGLGMSGPSLLPALAEPACLAAFLATFDIDADGDADLADFARFQP